MNKKLLWEFLKGVLDEFSIDQIALLTTWSNEHEDSVEYFTNWLDLGSRIADYIDEYELQIFDIKREDMEESYNEAKVFEKTILKRIAKDAAKIESLSF